MVRLRYSYKTKITFSENVRSHYFLLRFTPNSYPFQQLAEDNCSITPLENYSVGTDVFGNKIFSGHIGDPHTFFEFEATGVVEQTHYRIEEELNRIYLYPSKLTKSMTGIDQIFNRIDISVVRDIEGKVKLLSRELHQTFRYVPGVTNVHTTAEQALEIGSGVCQDYAHILIALCRKGDIPARYVTGFMRGEGFTHAWIEYYDNGVWYGFDPTHDRKIETGYIKIAHGRDYEDCIIDRGIFSGLAQQKLEVFLKVEQEQ